jgi:hypothetical protein
VSASSAGASAGVSRTQVGKRKATVNPTPRKKAKKATGKSASEIKINEAATKASPALTPPSGPRKNIPIHQSNRYTHSRLPHFLDQFVTCEPLRRVPRDINPDSSTKSVPMNGQSPKADKPPTPNIEKSMPESLNPPSLGGAQNSPRAGGTPSSSAQASPSSGLAGAFSGSRPAESPKTSPPGPQSYGLRSANGYPLGGDSFVPHPEKQP